LLSLALSNTFQAFTAHHSLSLCTANTLRITTPLLSLPLSLYYFQALTAHLFPSLCAPSTCKSPHPSSRSLSLSLTFEHLQHISLSLSLCTRKHFTNHHTHPVTLSPALSLILQALTAHLSLPLSALQAHANQHHTSRILGPSKGVYIYIPRTLRPSTADGETHRSSGVKRTVGAGGGEGGGQGAARQTGGATGIRVRAQRAQRAQGSRARGQTAMSATVTCGSTATVLRVPRMISASNRRACPGAQPNKRGARGSTLPQGAGSREQPHLTARVVVQVEVEAHTLQPCNTFVVLLECARTHGRSFRERRPAVVP